MIGRAGIPALAVAGVPLLLVAVIWAWGGFPAVTVDGITAFPVLRGLAGALFIGALAAMGLAWWLRGRAGEWDRWLVLTILALLVAAICVERLYTVNEAFERDLMAYMMVADGVLDGRPLYGEMWDHKPPGIYWVYALSAVAFGVTPWALWAMGFVMAILTLWGCYRAGTELAGRDGGLIAAAVWALVSGDLMLQANQPNTEAFMNPALVWAFVWLLRAQRMDAPRALHYALIGLLFFTATLFKYYVGLVAIFTVAMHLAYMMHAGKLGLGGAVAKGAIAAGVALGGWALVVVYFWASGTLDAAWDILVGYNLEYGGSLGDNLLGALDLYAHPLNAIGPYLGLLIVAIGVLAAGANIARGADTSLLLVYLLSALLVAVMTGRFFEHYYQLLLPPLAIGAGAFAASTTKAWKLPAALVAIALVPILLVRGAQYDIPLAQVPLVKYARYGNEAVQFVETQRMAPFINQTVSKDQTVYHLGFEPSVYFWAGRKAPTGFVLSYPLYIGSVRSPAYIERELTSLKELRPDLIVAKRMFFARADNDIEVWIARHYRLIEGPPGTGQYLFLVPAASTP